MKYEVIFGNQGLFSVAPTDATAVWVDEDGGNFYYKLDSGGLHSWDGSWHNCVNVTDDICFSAMRRIIAEPKRWTWEDQKAGRMPEVDWVVTTYDTKRYVFVGESCHENQWSLRDAESGKVYHTPITWVLPLETPEEKAQRLEDEWVDAAYGNTYVFACVAKDEENRLKEHLRSIYKAQISGDLPAPGKE